MRGVLVLCVLAVVFVVTSCLGGCAVQRDPWVELVDRSIDNGSVTWWQKVKGGW